LPSAFAKATADKTADRGTVTLTEMSPMIRAYCGRATKFFISLGRDGAPRRPGVAARRPYLRRLLSCARLLKRANSLL